MIHTKGRLEISEEQGDYPVCILPSDDEIDNVYINLVGVEDDTRESADEDAKFIMWCYDNSDFIEQVAQLKEALVRLVRPSVEGAVMNALSELVTAATSNKEKST